HHCVVLAHLCKCSVATAPWRRIPLRSLSGLTMQGLIPERLPGRRLFAWQPPARLSQSRQFSAGSEMKKKLLLSVLTSLGILVVGVGAAYAINTFKANQDGFRPAGE